METDDDVVHYNFLSDSTSGDDSYTEKDDVSNYEVVVDREEIEEVYIHHKQEKVVTTDVVKVQDVEHSVDVNVQKNVDTQVNNENVYVTDKQLVNTNNTITINAKQNINAAASNAFARGVTSTITLPMGFASGHVRGRFSNWLKGKRESAYFKVIGLKCVITPDITKTISDDGVKEDAKKDDLIFPADDIVFQDEKPVPPNMVTSVTLKYSIRIGNEDGGNATAPRTPSWALKNLMTTCTGRKCKLHLIGYVKDTPAVDADIFYIDIQGATLSQFRITQQDVSGETQTLTTEANRYCANITFSFVNNSKGQAIKYSVPENISLSGKARTLLF